MKKSLSLIIAVLVSLSAQGQSLYRLVQGKVIPRNSRDWTIISDGIEVKGFLGGALLCTTFTMHEVNTTTTVPSAHFTHVVAATKSVKTYKDSFVLTNYPTAKRCVIGDVLRSPIAVMRIDGMGARALYDYGVDYTPPERKLTPEEAAAAKAQAVKMNAVGETAKLKFDEEQAENGKDLYQYRMGMRYLNGDGVEKDPAKASEYLEKSAAQGNQDAVKALAKHASQQTH
jgi:hypothetical protein